MDRADATLPLIPFERWRWFTRLDVRNLDRRAVEDFGLPSIILMENAGAGAAGVAAAMLPREARVLVLCGGGNNGGDGLVIARHLHNHLPGLEVHVALAGRGAARSPDAATNLSIVRRMGLSLLEEATPGRLDSRALGEGALDLVVDALLGTGLSEPVRGDLAELIAWSNASRKAGARVLAVDLPSGMDCDSGRELGRSVRADVTVTFAGPKVGFATRAGRGLVGSLAVVDIGAPRLLCEELGGATAPIGGEPPPSFAGY